MPHMHEPKEHDAKWNKPDKNNKYCLIPLKWSTQGGQIQRQGMRRKEWEVNGYRISDICCLAPKLCPTFFEPMGYSTPGFPVLYFLCLLKFMSIELAMLSNHLILCHPPFPFAFNLSQHQGLFQWVGPSHQGAKVLKHQHQSFQWIFRIDFF